MGSPRWSNSNSIYLPLTRMWLLLSHQTKESSLSSSSATITKSTTTTTTTTTKRNLTEMIVKFWITNLDELSLWTVLALPKASRTGLDSSNCCRIISNSSDLPAADAMYWRISFDASVLPEPLSPVITITWSQWKSRKDRHASSASAYLSIAAEHDIPQLQLSSLW